MSGELYLLLARSPVRRWAVHSSTTVKEFVMDKSQHPELEQELQLVELGDAKELTMGPPVGTVAEDSQQFPFKLK